MAETILNFLYQVVCDVEVSFGGLSLRIRGRGFPLASITIISIYIYEEIEEKENQIKSLAV